MPSSGITVSYNSFISNFLRNLHTVLHSDYISLHFHQQCKRVPFSPHALQHLLLVVFLIMIVLNCISLITSDAEHFFMGLFSIYLYVFFGELSV